MSPNEREFLDWLKAQRKRERRLESKERGRDVLAECGAQAAADAYEKAEAKFRKVFLTEAE